MLKEFLVFALDAGDWYASLSDSFTEERRNPSIRWTGGAPDRFGSSGKEENPNTCRQ
jgi:hypothetical protein